MAGILSGLLALFGLGGCKQEEPSPPPEFPEILDGPGMMFDPACMYIEDYNGNLWTDPVSGQTLCFTRDTLTLRQGDTVLWEGAWETDIIDYANYIAIGAEGQPVGDYAYFAVDFFKLPEDADPACAYLAAYPVDRASDEEYVLFRRSK